MEKQTEQSFENVLGEVSENAAMVSSKAWARFMDFIRGWERDSFEQMAGNASSRPMTYMKLQLRWQQREALVRGSMAWADQAVKQRDEMFDQMKRELQNA